MAKRKEEPPKDIWVTGNSDDADLEFSSGGEYESLEECSLDAGGKIEARAIVRHEKVYARRAWGEKKLSDIIGLKLEDGASCHVMSGGDIDSLSFLMHIISQQNLDYCLFSTWCMAMPDVLQFGKWLEEGKIKRIDAYVGEIFVKSYHSCWTALSAILKHHGGRVCVFRNHAKIFAGTGDKFDFSIESSANINTNPRTENTTITISTEMFQFYKDFFDGIVSFDRTFDEWKKWTNSEVKQ